MGSARQLVDRREADQVQRGKVGGLERLLLAYGRHFPLAKGKLRLIEALWRHVARTPLRTTRLKCGFSMSVDLREALQRQFYFTGTYLTEASVLRDWKRASASAATIFDVGANQGIYTLTSLALRSNASLHAFEPAPEVAEALRRTLRANGLQATVVQAAASNYVGEARLNRCPDGNEGMNFITPFEGGERVATITLDDYCLQKGIDRVSLLKLDIQGAEADALDGARGLLANAAIGTIFTELNWTDGNAASRAVGILDGAGYVFRAPGSPTWRPAGSWLEREWEVIASRS